MAQFAEEYLMFKATVLLTCSGLLLSMSARASECTLTVDDQTYVFAHVWANSVPNDFDNTQKDTIVRCYRESVPDSKKSAEEIIWFSPDSGSIEIKIASGGQVTAVNIHTPQLTASKSGLGFGVTFTGQIENGAIRGTISTPEALVALHDGQETVRWRIAASLDMDIAEE